MTWKDVKHATILTVLHSLYYADLKFIPLNKLLSRRSPANIAQLIPFMHLPNFSHPNNLYNILRSPM